MTDTTEDMTGEGGAGPAIVLVEPQLGENIGAAARAMANFGLTDLRLVNPRDGWPNVQAERSASRADHVIAATRVFDSVEAAVADLSFVFATTARQRDIAKPVVGPKRALATARARAEVGQNVGFLFGRERWGLNNEEVALADEILTLPVMPEFASLNIAQAVLVIAYEWRTGGGEADAPLPFAAPPEEPAPKSDLVGLFEHLESALDRVNYFRPPEKRQRMVNNIRALLQRARLSAREVKTLRGIVAALEVGPISPEELAALKAARLGRHLPKAKPGAADETE